MRKRTARLAAGAAVLVLALAGCAGTADQPQATPALVDAAVPAEPTPAETASAAVAPTEAESPTVEKRTVTEKRRIRYSTRTVEDPDLAEGTERTRTRGVHGVRTLTYEVTVTDGEQTAKKLITSVVTRKPVTRVVAIGTRVDEDEAGGDCDPNYSGACVPVASDVDCAGGSGNGPEYVDGPVRVVGNDVYDLDRDGDDIACD